MIWKSKRSRRKSRSTPSELTRRAPRPQRLERRELLAADPIHVGLVYLETDYLESDNDVGSDSQGDRFLLSFTGGAPETELGELRIRTDKDGDGISVGDPIFDTELGGRGKSGAHPFRVIQIETADGRQATATASVADGGQELVLNLQNFRAGDRLEFTLDVDEVLRNVADLDLFNDRLDVITSGQEFQDSILEAVFEAPHFETATADALFLNDYGSPGDRYGLDLPDDQGSDPDSRPNRSAAAIGSAAQTPKPVAISGHVWLDNNLDAVWQDGESPLADAELALRRLDQDGTFRETGLSTRTDANGAYHFSKDLGLMPGTYQVVQTQPQGLFSVAAVPGSVDGDAVGVVLDENVISSIEIPLGDTEAVQMDFAEAAPASLGGVVYRDDNDNGRRESGEAGIAGVTVRLVPLETIGEQAVVETTTGGDGTYRFAGLAPGRYEVIEVTQPADFVDGQDAAGTIGGVVVGRAENPGDRIVDVVLAGADRGEEYNFGELALGELSGHVYLAAPGEDCDGVYDLGQDQPLAGVAVELHSAEGRVVARVTTDAAGRYRFDDLAPGEYRIVQLTPDGLLDGGAIPGTVDGTRVGVADGGSQIRQIVVTPGGIGLDYNFCEIAPATLSGDVYHDRSGDGLRDAGESGIPGVSLSLVDESGTVVATALTDAAGRYQFAELPPGTYSIRQQQPAGYLDGKDAAGTIGGALVGVVGDDLISQVRLPQGTRGIDYNFGEQLPATLTGTVHADLDGDCLQDPGEPGLGGVVLRVLDDQGNQVAVTETNAEGVYRFTGLTPGRYTVVQQQPQGYFDGGVTAGSHGGVTSPNRISQIELGSDEHATDYDFCEEPPASLAGTVHLDRDGGCVQETGEPGLEGVLIELRDGSGATVATTRTDTNGDYRFDGLRGGSYTVFEHQPEGFFQGGVKLGSAGGAVVGVDLMSVTLRPGQDAVDYLFCEYEPNSIEGWVWSDHDQDERRDADESPIENVTIVLLDENGLVVETTQTDASGRYSFDDLERGVYGVRQVQPDGFFHSGQVIGDRGGSIARPDWIVGIELVSSDVARGYDFPEIPPATLSGVVFVDGPTLESETELTSELLRQYRDGQFTADDTPLAGVTIEVRDRNGQPLDDDAFLRGDAANRSVVLTGTDGSYVISGLRPGTYTLFQTQPAGWIDSIDTPGTTGGVAVNAGQTYGPTEQALIEAIPGTESADAILDVVVAAAEHSRDNNFSEVDVQLVVPPEEPPEEPPVVEPPETPPPSDFLPEVDQVIDQVTRPLPDVFPARELAFGQGQVARRRPPRFLGDVDAVTWHLSIINGGYPRGTVQSGETIREVAMKRVRSEDWSAEEKARGQWRLMTMDGEIHAESERMNLGAEDAVALAGDFDGDGDDEVAIYVAGRWYVDLNGNGVWDDGDLWILLGTEMDRPVVGDWDGDGKDDIGIYGRKWERDLQRVKLDAGLPDPSNRTRRFLENRKTLGLVSVRLRDQDRKRWLRRSDDGPLRADAVDHVFQYGEDVDTPISGDWNGDGIDQIGIFRTGKWMLDTEGDGRRKAGETRFEFGRPGDQPIVGDFDGDGIDEVGVIRGDQWIIDSDGDRRLTAADQRIDLPGGSAERQPVTGDWDGDGADEPGYYDQAG